MSKRSAKYVLASAAAVCGLLPAVASCGIDADQLSTPASEQPTTTGEATTTTEAPIISLTLPSIPPGDPNTTQSTAPNPDDQLDTTEPGGVDNGQVTPNGLTISTLADQLAGLEGLNEESAACLAPAMFDEFTGDEVDQIFVADDVSELSIDLVTRFTSLVQNCLG